MSGEENGVDVAQAGAATGWRAVGLLRILRDDVRVGADEGVPHARLVAEPLDDRQRMCHRFVLSLAIPGIGPGEDALAPGATAAAATGRALIGLGRRGGLGLLRCRRASFFGDRLRDRQPGARGDAK